MHQRWEEGKEGSDGDGTTLVICEAKVRRIHPERFIEYFKNQMEILPTYNKKVRLKQVDSDGDF